MAINLPRFVRAVANSRKIVKHNVPTGNGLSFNWERQYSSALYVSGRKANKSFTYLSPYLDFDNRLADMDKFKKDLESRGLNIDANEIKESWDYYKTVDASKRTLEQRFMCMVNDIKKFANKKDLTAEEQQEFEKLKVQFKIVKEDFANVKNIIWDLDETIIEKLLKLPNEVDKRTPLQSPTILKRAGTINQLPDKDRKSHIEIGRTLGLLEYKNPMHCYLCNDAALFELGVLGFAGKIFSAEETIRVAGSDFSRSLVVEGSGLNHENPWDAFVIDNYQDTDKNSPNRMHLVGGASLISFLALHAKQLINPNNFPLKYFSTGRQYTPFPQGSTPIGLFTICQASAVHAFTMVKDPNSEEYNTQFEKLLNTVCKLYDNVCDHYQIVVRPASELRPWETMRVSFELWSPFTKQYIEVGHVSVCGTYFSKRLLIAYQTPHGRDFPAVISGTVLSVPRLLGCLLEQNPEKFVIPPKIAQHMPTDYITPQI